LHVFLSNESHTMKLRWNVQPTDAAEVQHLSNAINVSLPIARALWLRGVRTFDAAKAFFRPQLSSLVSPFLMKDMNKAAERLCIAIAAKEKILIYGDYDVDGTTATSMLYLFLKEIGADVAYYINDRQKEGYGVAISGLSWAKQNGFTVVVSVDCGITAIEQAAFAKANGLDFIICDHHEAGSEGGALPDAFAILDPKQPECSYPFKELSGCGVAFKLMQAVSETLKADEKILNGYLDFVALAIAADIVKMNGENRILMSEGIKRINQSPRLWMIALAEEAGLNLPTVSSSQILFSIGPRINAAGRLGDARRAVELMTATTEAEARTAAKILELENLERQTIDRETFAQAERQAASQQASGGRSALVLYDANWHAGVIGIVASRIVEKFYLPTIMLTNVDGVLKGSVRSISGLNIYDAMCGCADLMIQFGGHAYAAGLTMELANLEAFRKKFNGIVAEKLTLELQTPEIKIDSPLSLADITPSFFNVLKQFAPFGPENPRPVFMAENVRLAASPRLMKEVHVKLTLTQEDSGVFEAVAFNRKDLYDFAMKHLGAAFDIAFTVEENNWNGKESIQLKLRDIKLS
jgi:single-stranded-DNA-specific exonuclease